MTFNHPKFVEQWN